MLAALLLGGGGGAFAVASLDAMPDAVRIRQVLEAVQPLPLQEQADALDSHAIQLYRSEVVRSTDTVEALLARLGVSDAAAAAFLRTDPAFRANVRAGRTVTAETTASNTLERLTARWAPRDDGNFNRLVVERTSQGSLRTRLETVPLTAATRLGSGTIRTSLFTAADEGGVPEVVAVQLADIFAGDIDFRRALRKGDRFNVVYEALEADGEPLRTGRVLAAEFVNGGKLYQALWFQEPGTKGGYYTPDGKSLQGAYLASPMEFSRVTSGFAMRMHPIHRQWKAHLGVDYGAPTGTPVRVVGDGVVAFAGVQNGFGNVVIVRHAGADETVYAHLSRIDAQRGQSVSQGQRIGAVGSTGWATGPHLHFEFRVNGIHKNPQLIAQSTGGTPLSASTRPAFDRLALALRTELKAAASVVARAD